MNGHAVEITPGLVIQFVDMTPPGSAAEQLIDEGRLVRHAERDCCPHLGEAVKQMSKQKVALAKLAFRASRDQPALMFRAMVEGWSAFKVRFELNKLAGTAGKGEGK